MKLGIVCAMEEELQSIIYVLGIKSTTITNKSFTFYTADYGDHELAFILCGIGKVNAAIHTQFLLDCYDFDYIINVGVAGSLSDELSFGDVVIANDLVQHDVNVTAFGLPLGQIPRMDVFAFPACKKLLDLGKGIGQTDFKILIGRIITGDQFIESKEHALSIHNEFNALACEMEGAAVAQVCYTNKVPFLVVRALSDMAGRTGTAVRSFEELKHMAAARSSYVVKELLALL